MRCRNVLLLFAIIFLLTGCADEHAGTATHDPEAAPESTFFTAESEPFSTIAPSDDIPLIQPIPNDADLVRIRDHIPDIFAELPYATEENFTGQVIYEFSDPWLRYGTVKKLALVQEKLLENGLSLKIWDGYRPKSAQQKLWEICPDPTYVSDPAKGSNSHCRGIAVDVTLVDRNGREVVMPTGFDDFSALADRDYYDCSQEAAENAQYLEDLMIEYGFNAYYKEWWHFSDTQEYPLIEDFEPLEPVCCVASCDEFISLRTIADASGTVIAKIPADDEMLALARSGDFLLVEYCGVQGYVLERYTKTP